MVQFTLAANKSMWPKIQKWNWSHEKKQGPLNEQKELQKISWAFIETLGVYVHIIT